MLVEESMADQCRHIGLRGGGAADAAFALFPFLVARDTNAHERCDLRLSQWRPPYPLHGLKLR